MPGLEELEYKIKQMEELLEEMPSEIREGHSTLKLMRKERQEITKLITTDVKAMVTIEVEKVIKAELDKIAPTIREQTNTIYAKVNSEVDKLIDLCLGKEFSKKNDREDLRPFLAVKLRTWIKEIVTGEGVVWQEGGS